MTQQSEQILIQRAVRGDQRAYSSLYHAHCARIAATVAQRTDYDDDIDDLVQQTFIRAFRALPRFRGDAAFSTWLTRIAMNVCNSHHDGRRVTLPLDALDRTPESAGHCPKPRPDQVLQQKQQVGRVVREIDALPERYRRALQLHYIEDRPYPEIVEQLGVPSGTIKTWLHRGRNRIRASIEAADAL